MEKNQYNLCIEILKRMNNANVLKDILVIGSWCIPFYSEYFSGVKYLPSIKTRDIDFLVPMPSKIKATVDIPDLLKDLGFVIGYKGSKGYIKLEHPDLVIEFLVPEKGRGMDKPYSLPQLGLNAQALRFLNLLAENTILVKIHDIPVMLPHPANFALHKLIIFQRRKNPEKIQKDKEAAVNILKALVNKGETDVIKNVFNSLLPKWRKKVVKGLENAKEKELLEIITADYAD